jgi:sulfite reductase alpha subunit-like flavoprotein
MSGVEEAPREPDASECCGTGCLRCVWDSYYDNVTAYEQRKRDGELRPATPDDDAAAPVAAAAAEAPASYSVVIRYATDEDVARAAVAADATRWHERLSKDGFTESTVATTRVGGDVAPAESENGIVVESTVALGAAGDALPPSAIEPGHCVEVLAENAPAAVAALVERLNLASGATPELPRVVTLTASPFGAANSFPPWLPRGEPVVVATLFRYFVDISSSAPLRPQLFALLAQHTKDAGEKARLAAVAALPRPAFKAAVLAQYPSLLDVLAAFPGAMPPLARLLEQSTPLRARPFSIAGWRADAPRSLDLCFREVRHARQPRPDVAIAAPAAPTFEGHSTAAMCSGQAVWCRPPWRRAAPRGPLGHALAPGALTGPLVVIAGGTGIAPCRALLQHRIAAASRLQGGLGPLLLLYGCRHAADFAYRAEWPAWATHGAAHVIPCISRGSMTLPPLPVAGDTIEAALPRDVAFKHVTDALAAQQAAVWAALRPDAAGHVVCCGPGAMVDAVRGALPDALARGRLAADRVASDGDDLFEDLCDAGRFHTDDWAHAAGDGVLWRSV